MKKHLTTLILLIFLIKMQAQSPYISRVYDFCPAPGQFVNKLPEYEEGDTRADIIRKVEECIVGDEKILVSLGGYGGYVIFGFDHLVENRANKYDFKIWGNAFYADANPNPNAPAEGGSCEPGIVMVSFDANGNNIPDDPWYELAGSEYRKPQTIKNYRIIYYKPDPNKTPIPNPDYPFLNDTTYIKWKSNQEDSGYVARNTFHLQSYYPQWIEEDSLVFKGTKLANNYIDESGEGSYYVQYAYGWGYADNHPNDNDRSNFDISWAVDSLGNAVQLPGIHFVKVYTGVNQYCGWLGETSTEIMGAEDLHLQGIDIDVQITGIITIEPQVAPRAYSVNNTLFLHDLEGYTCHLITMQGTAIDNFHVTSTYEIRPTNYPSGMYILRCQKQGRVLGIKVIIR